MFFVCDVLTHCYTAEPLSDEGVGNCDVVCLFALVELRLDSKPFTVSALVVLTYSAYS